MEMHKTKKRPKQNFSIVFENIYDLDIPNIQKRILAKTLRFHKVNCIYEYKNILNSDLTNELGISEPTLISHRKSLINDKYFGLKKIRIGKSFLLQYRFNWSKLTKLNLIKTEQKSEYTPTIKKSSKSIFEEGQTLSKNDIPKFKDDNLYEVKQYQLDEKGNRNGNGITQKHYGKSLKISLKIQDRKNELEYVFIQVT